MTAYGGTGSKILIVDDRPENLLALEAILSGLEHELVRATSGEEALKRLLTDDFALILLDVQMPGMDGFETAARIKARPRTSQVPIVFLTAIDAEAHQAFRSYTAGGVDYLTKPFDPWVLRAKVGVFIELHERRRELAEQAEDLRRQLAGHDCQRAEPLLRTALDAVGRASDALGAGLPELSADLEAAATALHDALKLLSAGTSPT